MTNSTVSSRRALSFVLVICGGFAGANALAADATTNAPSLEEIIVTAQKRSENLQDVPISVVAVSAQQIKDAGITNIRNLPIMTPGLTVTSEGNEAITTARIRGIGTVGDNVGLESSVGVNIDGVYRPRNGVAFGDLGEIDQIEVLYGPQGELFGKNNDAGVINVTTKRPSSTFGATAEITGGNFNDKEFRGSITGPLSNIMAGRLYFGFEDAQGFLRVNDGIGPSTINNTNDRHAYTSRGQLLITPSDDLDILFIADYSKRNESCCSAVLQYSGGDGPLLNALAATPILGGVPGATGIGAPAHNSYLAFANQPITQHVRDMGVSAEVNWNLGFGKLTSITAWRDNTVSGGNDVDYSGVDLLQVPDSGDSNITDFKQFSEELRLAGKSGSLNWLVGAFYAGEILRPEGSLFAGNQFETYVSLLATGGANPFLISTLTHNAPGGTLVGGVTGYDDIYSQNSKSYALFTNETYNITQGLDLTVGLRGTEEKKDETAHYQDRDHGAGCGQLLPFLGVSPALGFGCFTGFDPLFDQLKDSQSMTENNLSGTVKLAYRFNDQILAYASFANGYKSGGFNLSRVTQADNFTPNLDTAFPRETVESYEIGLKTTLFDKSVRINLAAFDQKYTDFQLNTFTGIQFVVTSLPKVESKGVDLDFAWATPITGLTLAGGVTQDLTNINNFGNALIDFNPLPGQDPATGNGGPPRQNNRLSFAPLWSGALSASYEVPLSSTMGLRMSVQDKYNSSYNTGSDLDPRKIQGAFGLLNARIGIGALDEAWAIEAWGANLADKYYYGVAFDAPFQPGTIDSYLGAPRTFGLTARVKFK
jgi:iron complex outermembrane recepter protein